MNQVVRAAMVALTSMLAAASGFAETRHGPTDRGDVFSSNPAATKAPTRCNLGDCACAQRRAIEAREVSCPNTLQSFDDLIRRKEHEVAGITRVEEQRQKMLTSDRAAIDASKAKVAAKERELEDYRAKMMANKARYAATCDCMRPVYEQMCSLPSQEFQRRAADCAEWARSQDGAKEVRRVPSPSPAPVPSAEVREIVDAMHDCLHAKVPYYTKPVGAFPAALAGRSPLGYPALELEPAPRVLYDPIHLNRYSPTEQTLLLARPVAEYVLHLRAETYSPEAIDRARKISERFKGRSYDRVYDVVSPLSEIDELMGFLTRCVHDRGLTPTDGRGDPRRYFRALFADYDTFGRSEAFWRMRVLRLGGAFNTGWLPGHIAMDYR